MRRNRISTTLTVLLAIASTIAMLLGTPSLLRWLERAGGGDWNMQSAIGQAYSGVAAVIGTLALGGVAGSLILQSREAAASHEQLRRKFHVELTMKALDDPDLLECWGTFSEGEFREKRQHLYSNQIMSFWSMMYSLGKMSDIELHLAASDVFGTEAGRRYWSTSGPYWHKQYSTRSDRQFLAIIDSEFSKAAVPQIHDDKQLNASDNALSTLDDSIHSNRWIAVAAILSAITAFAAGHHFARREKGA